MTYPGRTAARPGLLEKYMKNKNMLYKVGRGMIFAVVLMGVTMSCNFVNPDPPGSSVDVRTLDDSIWARKAIAYSGYRDGQSPDDQIYPSEAEILQDLNLLVTKGFGLIRLYDTSIHGKRTLKVISDNNLDLKVMLGAYLYGGDTSYGSANREQLDSAVKLANDYPDTVVAVSVGNEVLVDWSFVAVPPDDMVEYIRYVREAIEQPVTVNDNFEPYAMGSGYNTEKVWREIDFAAVHTYAYWDAGYNLWDWRQEDAAEADRARAMMDAALTYAKANFSAVRTALDEAGIDIPIVIGETGWQSVPSATVGSAQYTGHPVNQAMYYTRMQEWAYGSGGGSPGDGFERPKGVFYFASFDEPWKQADDNWGLWDAERQEKYVLSGSGYGSSDAVYYIPPAEAAVITENTFVIFRDAEAGAGEQTATHSWNPWDGSTASISTGSSGAPEGAEYGIVTPSPKSWGWGMTLSLTDPVDLSAFEDPGSIEFEIQSDYPGKLEIGFFTGNTTEQQGVDVYLVVDPASNAYGYANDGAWHTVSIPVSDITPNATPAYEQDATAALNMTEVYASFVIADRYAETGTTGSPTNVINLDNIRWMK